MATIESGATTDLLTVAPNTKSARVSELPTEVGAFGSFQLETVTGTMAAGLAGASTVYSCRWGSATALMLVRSVSIYAQNVTTAFSAGATLFDFVVARGFTLSDSAGASILPAANAQKKRTNFGTTAITDLRQSATAAITAGTRTPDAQPMGSIRGFVPATVVNYPMIGAVIVPGASTVAYGIAPVPLFQATQDEWPLVLTTDEGFIIRATVPATGTWSMAVRLVWDEVPVTGSGYR